MKTKYIIIGWDSTGLEIDSTCGKHMLGKELAVSDTPYSHEQVEQVIKDNRHAWEYYEVKTVYYLS